MRFDLPILLVILATDRITKIIVPRLMDLHQSVPVVPGFFHITYVRNTGAAFGILSGWNSPYRRLFFILASIAAIALLFFLYRQAAAGSSRYLRLSIVLIAAGALGNLYDRAITGHVVDFFDLFAGSYHWPAFNVADSSITVGVLVLGYLYLTGRLDAPSRNEESIAP